MSTTKALTEIKKFLYKHKPIACFVMIRKGVAYYESNIEDFNFQVPVNDMGDADFLMYMDAKLLIRYIVMS